jgi:hypothetical protein
MDVSKTLQGPLKDICQNIVELLERLPRQVDPTDKPQAYCINYMKYLQSDGAVHREVGFAICSILSFDQQTLMAGGTKDFGGCSFHMTYNSKMGRDIFYVLKESAHENEHEVLFAPGAEF